MPSEGGVEVIPGLLALPFKMNPVEVRLQILQRGRPKPMLSSPKKDANRVPNREFNMSWYEMYPWLCGTLQLNKLFCWPCLLMRPESSSWCATGVEDINRVPTLAAKHCTCKTHLKAIGEYDGVMLEAGLPSEFTNQTSQPSEMKLEKDSDTDSDYLGRYLTPKQRNQPNDKTDQGASSRPTLTFSAWQQASRAILDSNDPKLARRKRKLASIEIKNAELTGEKLRLEIQLLKAKLELQQAINIASIEPPSGETPHEK